MKVKELKAYLSTTFAKDEDEVCVKLAPAGMGGSNVAYVKSCGTGFDWDSGKFILSTEEELVKTNKEQRRK